jgi:hypothetical protein
MAMAVTNWRVENYKKYNNGIIISSSRMAMSRRGKEHQQQQNGNGRGKITSISNRRKTTMEASA